MGRALSKVPQQRIGDRMSRKKSKTTRWILWMTKIILFKMKINRGIKRRGKGEIHSGMAIRTTQLAQYLRWRYQDMVILVLRVMMKVRTGCQPQTYLNGCLSQKLRSQLCMVRRGLECRANQLISSSNQIVISKLLQLETLKHVMTINGTFTKC